MTEVVAWMGGCQHPAAPFQWRLSPEALASFAEQAPGLVVLDNYDQARPVGRVTAASVDGDGLALTLDLIDDFDLGGRELGPAFTTDLLHSAGPEDSSRYRGHTLVKEGRLREFGVLPEDYVA